MIWLNVENEPDGSIDQMQLAYSTRLVGAATLNRADEQQVHIDEVRGNARTAHVDALMPMDTLVKLMNERAGGRAVVLQLDVVKGSMDPLEVFVPVLEVGGLAKQLPHALKIVLGELVGKGGGKGRFEQQPNRIQLLGSAEVHRADRHAPVGARREHTFGLKHPHRLAQGRAANLEGFREIGLAKLLSGRIDAFVNQLPQPCRDIQDRVSWSATSAIVGMNRAA